MSDSYSQPTPNIEEIEDIFNIDVDEDDDDDTGRPNDEEVDW